ncbi:MAG: hypothetical protein RLP09_32675 [Sandaracinaceae bacterium]
MNDLERAVEERMAAVEVDRREIDRRVDGACPRPSTPRVLEVLGVLVAFSGLVAAPLASARYLGLESLLVVGPLAAALLVWGLARLERDVTRDRWYAHNHALAGSLLRQVFASGGVVRRAALPPVRPLRYVDFAFLAEYVGLRNEGPFIVDPARSQAAVAKAEARWRRAAAQGQLGRARVRKWERDPTDALALYRLLQRRALERTPDGVRPVRSFSPYRDGPAREERRPAPTSVVRVRA